MSLGPSGMMITGSYVFPVMAFFEESPCCSGWHILLVVGVGGGVGVVVCNAE
jgi:hypothetical protein